MALEAHRPTVAKKGGGDWDRITTTLRPQEWERALSNHPDRVFAEYICKGISRGFHIGFNYQQAKCKSAKGNMRSVQEHKEVVEHYLGVECQAKRLLGPFNREDHPQVQVSPFGVIPKSEPGKWRLILDLSSPQGQSVNDGISKELCSLSYMSVDDVAEKVVKTGRGALMAKFDLKSAYRHIPVHPDDRWLLGMEWDGGLFVDTTLPFGLRSAPMIFNAVAEALAYVIRERGVKNLDHYLDDFSLVAPPASPMCKENLGVALGICEELGFQVASEKTEGPATRITLLGIEIDSELWQLRLPQGKLQKLQELVERWRHRKACTKRDLQSLAGHLNHACKVVRPGRRFLRGVFGLLSQFHRRDHMIRLNSAFRADMEWWHVFASSWNGVSMMRDTSPMVEIWSDASGSWGCGAVWEDQWFQVQWCEWPGFAEASIAAKELLPIITATAVWGPRWLGGSVLCHCDNTAAVAAVRGGYCKDPTLAHMLRCLFYVEARFDLSLTAAHIPGKENRVADDISRNNLASFFALVPQAHREPYPVPKDLVGRLVTNKHWTSDDWKSWLEILSTVH